MVCNSFARAWPVTRVLLGSHSVTKCNVSCPNLSLSAIKITFFDLLIIAIVVDSGQIAPEWLKALTKPKEAKNG